MSTDTDLEIPLEPIGQPAVAPDDAPEVVEVRRRAGLAVALGAGASLVAIAYLARAVSGGSPLDWVLFVLLGAIGVVNLGALVDARTPLLVADDLGVRLRLGRTWVGLPWGGLHEIEHRPQRGWWRDGLIVVRPHYVQRVLEDLDPPARRTARLNRRLHRAPLAVPLGLATRCLGAEPDLTAALARLADGRSPVVEAASVPEAVEAEVVEPVEPVEPARAVTVAEILAAHGVESPVVPAPRRLRDPRPAIALLIGNLAARFERTPREDADDLVVDEVVEPEIVASATPEPARDPAVAARAEVRHEARAVLDDVEDGTEAWGDLHAEPETEVVGPLLIDAYGAHAGRGAGDRARLRCRTTSPGSERRRAGRPDADPAPRHRGDRGRRLQRVRRRLLRARPPADPGAGARARVGPLLAAYDERYADAPIDPRRVFEAELAGAGSIRATRGGPNWSILVAAVMALILCWSVARLITGGPEQAANQAVLSGSGGPNHTSAPTAKPVPVVLTAAGGGARVVVRGGTGTVVFSGELAFGQRHALQVSPPIRIQSTDGAVRVRWRVRTAGGWGPPVSRPPCPTSSATAADGIRSRRGDTGAAYSTPTRPSVTLDVPAVRSPW